MTATSKSVLQFLASPGLAPVWDRVGAHLQRRGLVATGVVNVELDDDGAERLGQILHTLVRPGRVRVDVAALDSALRASAARRGVVGVIEAVAGRTLVDRGAAKAQTAARWGRVWSDLDEAMQDAGLVDADWAGSFVADLRRTGLLTRAGVEAAGAAVVTAGRVWQLVRLRDGDGRRGGELGEIAAATTGTAHGLDATLTAAIVLRAAAAAYDVPVPATASQRRDLWSLMEVSVDQVSGTVLVWGVRPPGGTRWAHMMGERTEMGLVTHLSVSELEIAGAVVEPGAQVWVCENPQVLQVMARERVRSIVVCTAGNPASAGWMFIRQVLADGGQIAYHGDFDWAGVAIAGRVIAAGARPWRMSARDYAAALPRAGGQLLTESPVATPWDPQLAVLMSQHGAAVHEEALLDVLLGDVR
jgi:uncharacterized protein (TIGR02679 family)